MIDYLNHIDRETRRIVSLVQTADLTAPVATCGEWTVADLAWHMNEVQNFWAWTIGERASSPEAYAVPVRPAEDQSLHSVLDETRGRLLTVLQGTPPETPCWSWSSDQSAGFTYRRQAHEALVHRVDAELAIEGAVSPVDAELASDGVDEVLGVMIGGIPPWATFSPSSDTVRLQTSDDGAGWTVAFGRMTGTSPESGRSHDLEAVAASDRPDPGAVVAGPAADLDLWLWGRADASQLDVSGDPALTTRLRSLVTESTQ